MKRKFFLGGKIFMEFLSFDLQRFAFTFTLDSAQYTSGKYAYFYKDAEFGRLYADDEKSTGNWDFDEYGLGFWAQTESGAKSKDFFTFAAGTNVGNTGSFTVDLSGYEASITLSGSLDGISTNSVIVKSSGGSFAIAGKSIGSVGLFDNGAKVYVSAAIISATAGAVNVLLSNAGAGYSEAVAGGASVAIVGGSVTLEDSNGNTKGNVKLTLDSATDRIKVEKGAVEITGTSSGVIAAYGCDLCFGE